MASAEDRTLVESWSVRELKQWLAERQISSTGATEKSELVDLVVNNFTQPAATVAPAAAAPEAADPFEVFASPADLAKAGISLADVMRLLGQQRQNAPPPAPRTNGSDVQVTQVTESATQKNRGTIVCRKCGCTILRAGKGTFSKHNVVLPDGPAQPGAQPPASSEGTTSLALQAVEYQDHWLVPSPNLFDNLAFCRSLTPTATEKLLTCADCEYEAIGIHYLATHPEFPHHCFLTHDRVAYLSDQVQALPESPGVQVVATPEVL